jgi:hypothetical protein
MASLLDARYTRRKRPRVVAGREGRPDPGNGTCLGRGYRGLGIGAFWSGMELEMLLDIDGSEDHHGETVQAIEELLAQPGEKESTPLPRRAVRKKVTDRRWIGR